MEIKTLQIFTIHITDAAAAEGARRMKGGVGFSLNIRTLGGGAPATAPLPTTTASRFPHSKVFRPLRERYRLLRLRRLLRLPPRAGSSVNTVREQSIDETFLPFAAIVDTFPSRSST